MFALIPMRAIPDSGSFATISNRPLKRPQKLRPEIVDISKTFSKSPQKFREKKVDEIESSYICPQLNKDF
jgi:hypothetical protein